MTAIQLQSEEFYKCELEFDILSLFWSVILLNASNSLETEGFRIITEKEDLIQAITEMRCLSEMVRERATRAHQVSSKHVSFEASYGRNIHINDAINEGHLKYAYAWTKSADLWKQKRRQILKVEGCVTFPNVDGVSRRLGDRSCDPYRTLRQSR